MRRYEGMFLFDNAAAQEWSAIEREVRRLCDRIGAELQVCVKFDERRLAYEIQGRKRGTFVLTYFDAPPDRIAELERDVQLSELVLRALVVRADKLSEARLAELKERSAQTPLQPLSGDGRRHDEYSRGRRGPRPAPEAGAREPAGKPAATETAVATDKSAPADTSPGAPAEPEPAPPGPNAASAEPAETGDAGNTN